MSATHGEKGLTEQQRRFVVAVGQGMAQTAAARQAGYKFATVEAYQLMKNPRIVRALEKERQKYEHASMMTRKKVIDGLMEAVDIARTVQEPSSMVAGWREIARICGYFAPETKQINISVSGAVQVAQLESMTDDELLKTILEGESTRIPDELDDEEQALLEAPPRFDDADPPEEPVEAAD